MLCCTHMLWCREGCVMCSDPKCSNRASMKHHILTIITHSVESENLRTTLRKLLGGVILLICTSHYVSGKYTLGMSCLVYHQDHVASADS